MNLRVTTLLLFLFLLVAGTASAQEEVTIRELNALPQDTIDQLNAIGADPNASDEIETLIQSPYTGQEVVFTAVVLTDPYDSGLATWVDDRGGPGRIHVFVRDVAAATEGLEGMNMQIVDGDYENTGLINVVVGDVIRVTGSVSYFGTSMQFNVTTIEPLGSYTDNGLDDSIFDPVMVTTADLNMNVGDQKVQVNWDNYPDLIHQKVRFEDATILRRTLEDAGRPSWLWSTDGGETFTQNDDVSLRFRNDKIGEYEAPFNVRTDPFQPPPPGSVANIEGYVLYRGAVEEFDFGGIPTGEFLQVSPFEDAELVITETPPVISTPSKPDFVPGTDPVTITTEIVADPTRTVSDVVFTYETSDGAGPMTLQPTDVTGDTYTFEIPAVNDGVFVSYFVEATDNTGAVSTSSTLSYRVLVDGINEIEDVQLTADATSGPSPFNGISTDMDIVGTVQTSPDVSGFLAIQDDDTLAPWSGIVVELTDEVSALNLQPGDVVRITNASIVELRGPDRFDITDVVTGLATPTLTVESTGGDPLSYKTVTTDVLQDAGIAEAHESMLLRFDNVTVTDPLGGDGPSDFGEFSVGSDGDDAGVRVDDQSDSFPFEFNDNLFEGTQIAFIQGLWSNTFNNNKLMPESLEDVGTITATEDEAVPGSFVLAQNYPNPFNPVTTINYQIGQSTQVRLQVFDVLGRHVATLVDGVQPVGTHTVTFNGAKLASGLYMYRLDAGGTTQVKTMMLLK